MTSAATVLRKARELIERDGWCADEVRDESGERCIMAAIADASGTALIVDTAPYDFVREQTGIWGLATWNTTPGRTKAEVLDLLARAADLAEREESHEPVK